MSKAKTAKTEEKSAPAEKAVVTFYQRGDSKYSPRVTHTEAAWEKVQKCLMAKKNKASYKDLCDVLEHHFTKPDEDHHDFIGYMVRRGALTIVA